MLATVFVSAEDAFEIRVFDRGDPSDRTNRRRKGRHARSVADGSRQQKKGWRRIGFRTRDTASRPLRHNRIGHFDGCHVDGEGFERKLLPDGTLDLHDTMQQLQRIATGVVPASRDLVDVETPDPGIPHELISRRLASAVGGLRIWRRLSGQQIHLPEFRHIGLSAR